MSERGAPRLAVESSESDGSDPLTAARQRQPLIVALVTPDDAVAMASERAIPLLRELFGMAGREDDFAAIPAGFRRHVSALRKALASGEPPTSAVTSDLCCRGVLLRSEAGNYLLVSLSPSLGASRDTAWPSTG